MKTKKLNLNTCDKETQWTPPAAPALPPAPAPGGLPPGWESAQDPSSHLGVAEIFWPLVEGGFGDTVKSRYIKMILYYII